MHHLFVFRHHRFVSLLALLLALLGRPLTLSAQDATVEEKQPATPGRLGAGRTLSPGEIEKIRESLQARQREHEADADTPEMIPFEVSTTAPPASQTLGERGAVCLNNRMNTLRAFWTFEPLDVAPAPKETGKKTGTAGEARPTSIRLPQPLKGEEWIALAPGAWRLGLAVGPPDGSRPLRLPVRRVEVASGRVYNLTLSPEVEQQLKVLLRETRKQAAEAAEKKQEKFHRHKTEMAQKQPTAGEAPLAQEPARREQPPARERSQAQITEQKPEPGAKPGAEPGAEPKRTPTPEKAMETPSVEVEIKR